MNQPQMNSSAESLPEMMAMVFTELLTEKPGRLRQLQSVWTHLWATRHALVSPIVRGLMLLHEHWAYAGIGEHRSEEPAFLTRWTFECDQRRAPIHQMLSLAEFLLRRLARDDDALEQREHELGEEGHSNGKPGPLVPPRRLDRATASIYIEHIRAAYSSLSGPFSTWDRQFSEQNQRFIHQICAHSGYPQTRYVALSCLAAIDGAKWRLEVGAAASQVSRLWRSLFQRTCTGNKVIRALAQLLLTKTRPASSLPDQWAALRKDFERAAAMTGPRALALLPPPFLRDI